ncbi:MAG: hypothetical protein GW886_06020 [Rhodobacterales bacterium]|nr:hypothetical protein [Rhodobacterales bacterium]NCT12020.1 hypothetical protein [Rhodobacterales bacterium]
MTATTLTLAARLRHLGIDSRLIAFIPLSTIFAVGATALLLTLPAAIVAPLSAPKATFFLGLMGLFLAVGAWPITRPASRAVWVAAHWALRRTGGGEAQVVPIAAGLAGAAGAAAFTAAALPENAGPGILVLLIACVPAAAIYAARLIYGGATT